MGAWIWIASYIKLECNYYLCPKLGRPPSLNEMPRVSQWFRRDVHIMISFQIIGSQPVRWEQCIGKCIKSSFARNDFDILSFQLLAIYLVEKYQWSKQYPHMEIEYGIFLKYTPQTAKFMGPTWGPPGSCRPQMGPMLAPLNLLFGSAWKYNRPRLARRRLLVKQSSADEDHIDIVT